MTPEAFQRQRRRVAMRHPKESVQRKGLERLARTAGAKMVFIGGKHVAWVLPGGSTVCVKERFADEPRALAGMERIRAKQLFGNQAPTRAYHCSRCSGWHLTAKEKRNGGME